MPILEPPVLPQPPSTRVAPEPIAQGTLLLPVEELSRLSEIPNKDPLAAPAPPHPALASPFSTQRVPLQKAPAPVQPPSGPGVTAARPLLRAEAARTALPAPGSSAPATSPAKGSWKLWAGLAGLGVVAAAGVILWLKPGFLGLGDEDGGRRLLPIGGAGGPVREVPASLKSAKEKAEAGDAQSMRYLGTCYANGLFVPRDVEEAKRWFRRAAEAGSQPAREELAALQRLEK